MKTSRIVAALLVPLLIACSTRGLTARADLSTRTGACAYYRVLGGKYDFSSDLAGDRPVNVADPLVRIVPRKGEAKQGAGEDDGETGSDRYQWAVAAVNGEVITLEDFLFEVLHSEMREKAMEIMKGLVVEAVGRLEGDRLGITVATDDVADRLGRIIADLRLHVASLPVYADILEYLEAKGFESLDGFADFMYRKVESQILWGRLVRYMRLTTTSYQVRLVMVRTEEEANELLERVRAGEDMEEIARKNSVHLSAGDGGLMPPFFVDQPGVPPELAERGLSLPVGRPSEVFELPGGFTFIYVVRRRGGLESSYADLADSVAEYSMNPENEPELAEVDFWYRYLCTNSGIEVDRREAPFRPEGAGDDERPVLAVVSEGEQREVVDMNTFTDELFHCEDRVEAQEILKFMVINLTGTFESARLGVDVPEAALEAKYESVMEGIRQRVENLGTPFDEFLMTEFGFESEDAFRTYMLPKLRDSLAWERLAAYYDRTTTTYRARVILCRDLMEMEAVMRRLEAGDPFETVAEDDSRHKTARQGGLCAPCYLHQQGVPQVFHDFAETHGLDDISAPFEAEGGVMIMTMVELERREVVPYTDLRDEIEADVTTEGHETKKETVDFWWKFLLKNSDYELELYY